MRQILFVSKSTGHPTLTQCQLVYTFSMFAFCILRGNFNGKNGLLYTHPDIRFLTFIYIKIGRFFQNMFEKNQVARPLLEQSPS
jgi:hypothetical protein